MKNNTIEPELLSERDAAKFLGVSTRTMQGYRYQSTGPMYYRLGGTRVRYSIDDLLDWLERQRVDPAA